MDTWSNPLAIFLMMIVVVPVVGFVLVGLSTPVRWLVRWLRYSFWPAVSWRVWNHMDCDDVPMECRQVS